MLDTRDSNRSGRTVDRTYGDDSADPRNGHNYELSHGESYRGGMSDRHSSDEGHLDSEDTENVSRHPR